MSKKRKRMSREKQRDNAKKGGGGPSWFDLPEGVEEWAPEKAGSYKINVLPYEVTDKKHPDDAEVGSVWWKRLINIHHSVGVNNRSIVRPTSLGKKCPIHEEWEREKTKKVDKEDEKDHDKLLRDLRGQTYSIMNIQNPEDDDAVSLFVTSYGKFYGAKAGLKKEIEGAAEENIGFWDVKDGKTLKCRFSEESHMGKKYYEVTRIDFEDRNDMDEDDTLKKTVNLDECLNVLSYDEIKEMFLGSDDDDEDEKKSKHKKKGKKSKDEDEDEDSDEDDSDDDEDDDSDEDEPKKKKKSKDDDDDDSDDDSEDEDSEDDDDDEESEDEDSDDDSEDDDSDENPSKKKRR